MKKRICTYISLCGLLSSSAATFGMHHHGTSVSTTTSTRSTSSTTTSAATSTQSQPTLLEKLEGDADKAKEIVIDVAEKADKVLYPLNKEILSALQGNEQQVAQVVVALEQAVKIKPQNIQDVVAIEDKVVTIGTSANETVHGLIQKLEAAQVSPNPTSTTTTVTTTK